MSGNSTVLDGSTATLGWVSQVNTRGSFDIIWSCLKTITLCAWIAVCINVPASKHRTWGHIRDKFYFVLLTLHGPELVLMLAWGQLDSARRSVRNFQRLGYKDWTITHAFYADMGGVVIQPTGWVAFPVDAAQLGYLIEHGYLEYPQISREEIRNRAKSDGLARSAGRGYHDIVG